MSETPQQSASAEPAPSPASVMLVLEELDRYGGGTDDSISEMNVIPFIDICLVLLIIVLVATSFSVKLIVFEHALAGKGDAQTAAAPASPAATEYLDVQDGQGRLHVARVEIQAKGQVRLNGREIPMDELGDAVLAMADGEGECPPFLVAVDRKAESQYVVRAVDQIHRAGRVRIAYTVTGK
jgi:biopolymer transport protein ExbD